MYDYCLISNHLHLIIFSANSYLFDEARDFKKLTLPKITKAIGGNNKKSRRKGCYGYLKKPGKIMGVILAINFGNKSTIK